MNRTSIKSTRFFNFHIDNHFSFVYGPIKTATSFFLPHQNLAKSHHLSSGAKDSKPLKYINTDIREQNIYDYD